MAKVYLSPSTQFDNIYSGVDTNEGDICEKSDWPLKKH